MSQPSIIGSMQRRISYLESRLAFMERKMGLDREVDMAPAYSSASVIAIKNAVREKFGNNLMDARSHSPEAVFPRSIAMYLCRRLLGLSLPVIGRIFGKHHTTVHHAIERISARRAADPKLDAMLKAFEAHFSMRPATAQKEDGQCPATL